MIWRCVLDAPRDGAANMALDHALFESVQAEGRPVLRLYRWHPPCLSLGRNQTASGVFDASRAGTPGIDIVRRPTGGLAVWHDREVTYTVAAPIATVGRPRAAYESINRALAAGLAGLGVRTGIAAASGARASPLAHATNPCFAEAGAGEIVADGRKLVGSAMRVERRTILQHGSILIDGDQSRVTALMSGAAAPAVPPITLHEATGRAPSPGELADAIVHGFATSLGIRLEPEQPTDAECERARNLEARYRSEAWTWRR